MANYTASCKDQQDTLTRHVLDPSAVVKSIVADECGTVHQKVHTRDSQNESRLIKTYFNQLDIFTKCKTSTTGRKTPV